MATHGTLFSNSFSRAVSTFGLQVRSKDTRAVAGRVRSELASAGLDDPRVFSKVLEGITPEAFLLELLPGLSAVDPDLVTEVDKLLRAARIMTVSMSNSQVSPFLVDGVGYERGRLQGDRDKKQAVEAASSGEVWEPGPVKRRRVAPGSAVVAGSMASTEQREQSKWARKFVEMVRGKSFPAVVDAEKTDDPERALADLLGSSRPGTVRLRMRTWLAMSRWMVVAKGRAWPSCSADIVDYINARRDEDRKTSFPKQLASAVR